MPFSASIAAIWLTEHGFDVVGEARDGAEAVHMALSLTPDVVLMDIRMPEIDGIEATREIVSGSGDDSGDPRVLVGLGDSPQVTRVEVQWPDGKLERFPGVATDQAITLRRGSGEPAGG